MSGEGYLSSTIIGQSPIHMLNDMTSLAKVLPAAIAAPQKRKTKIICTMGPSCWSPENLEKLIDAGLNVVRLNFSHGDHATHGQTIENLQTALQKFPGKNIPVMLDTKGPEIRSGFFREDCGGKVQLTAGQTLKLTTDYSFKGDSTCIGCSYEKLPKSVVPGNQILMADGSVVMEVLDCGSDFVNCKVLNNATIGERKNMNLPGVHVDLPILGEKDKDDLLNFAIPQGCNFVAASFVQSADDVREIRALLGRRGRHIKIISKIENEAGLTNFDEILEETDGIMVARGDLGMEIPTEKVFLAQKTMIGKCNLKGKVVITATQMLESMCNNPRPTRAEASDVANAVLDGSDCVMLSGETAGGNFPVEAVSIMARICIEAESVIDYNQVYMSIRAGTLSRDDEMSIPESVCSSAVKAAIDTKAALIIALTETGSTARQIAKYRPAVGILALSATESSVKHLAIQRGVTSLQVPSFQGTDHVLKGAMDTAKDCGLVKVGDKVVCVHGMKEEVSGHSNLLKIVTVQ
jgi:pyruvate kinase